ncbi:substrate-binding domain-containing protein, partial [Eubacterium aggregans]|uniref:substrate-binding domain-containing protein n=1 Tax=Eubacterium aggregans TaxID=81409 RepID=UPI003F2ADA43
MKKTFTILCVTLLMAVTLAGCGGGYASGGSITVISHEDGSGTRGVFIELFGIEEKDSAGNKVDKTIDSADITNSISVMLTSVSGNTDAIGYVSLGSLNDTVKALKIDGAEATAANIDNGSYKISRPFNIITKEGLSDVSKDFVDYILSADGQAIVEEIGYIKASTNGAYAGTKPAGKITVAGSSSVTPVMEKLKEAYLKVNHNAEIEVQQSDSTTGVNSTVDGICDIGMASRGLKDSEKSKGVTATVIATDGIAVIVNKDNSVDNLTVNQVKDIYTGNITTWDEVAP